MVTEFACVHLGLSFWKTQNGKTVFLRLLTTGSHMPAPRPEAVAGGLLMKCWVSNLSPPEEDRPQGHTSETLAGSRGVILSTQCSPGNTEVCGLGSLGCLQMCPVTMWGPRLVQ